MAKKNLKTYHKEHESHPKSSTIDNHIKFVLTILFIGVIVSLVLSSLLVYRSETNFNERVHEVVKHKFGSHSYKDVDVVSDSNINLSQICPARIQSKSISPDTRVLLKDQTNESENGIYICQNDHFVRTLDMENSEDYFHGETIVDKNTGYTYRLIMDDSKINFKGTSFIETDFNTTGILHMNENGKIDVRDAQIQQPTSNDPNEESMIITKTHEEALLVRKAGDSGDVFRVDTANNNIALNTITVGTTQWTHMSNMNQSVATTDSPSFNSLTVGGTTLTSEEWNQLENINAHTISETHWGYLSAMDQTVRSTDDVHFNSIGIGAGVGNLKMNIHADFTTPGDVIELADSNGEQKISLGFNNTAGGADNGRSVYLWSNETDAGYARSMRFGTSDTEHMRITSTGLIGISQTNPQMKLHITWFWSQLRLENNSSNFLDFRCDWNSNFFLTNPSGINLMFIENPSGKLVLNNGGGLYMTNSIGAQRKIVNYDTHENISLGNTTEVNSIQIQVPGNSYSAYVQGTTGYWLFGSSSTPDTQLHLREDQEITANVTDGKSSTIKMNPYYHTNPANSFTVTNHYYMEVQNPMITGSLSVTDAYLFKFNEAAGTHKVLDTKGTDNGSLTNAAGTNSTHISNSNIIGCLKVKMHDNSTGYILIRDSPDYYSSG